MAHNVRHAVEGDELVIRVRITKDDVASAPPSSTGKSLLVGSTGGFERLNMQVGGCNLSVSAVVSATLPKGGR